MNRLTPIKDSDWWKLEEYKKLTLEEACLLHRYLYYVKSSPIYQDFVYDIFEKEAKERGLAEGSPLNKPGSSLEEDYPENIVKVANDILEIVKSELGV